MAIFQLYTKTVATCDKCGQYIDIHANESYIDAMEEYGCTFHVACFSSLTSFQCIKILGISAIYYIDKDGDKKDLRSGKPV